MEEKKLKSSCEEIKQKLIELIEEKDCAELEKLVSLNINFNPIDDKQVVESNKIFDKHYKNDNFTKSFKINKNIINKIVGDNWDKKFMHIFFSSTNNSLQLIFRFSDQEKFINWNLDLNTESAYLLEKNGSVIELNRRNDYFEEYINRFEKDFKNIIIKKDDEFRLTNYIAYEMNNILLFNGFEHDIFFELVCKDDNGKVRLNLILEIKDKDRVHHTRKSNRDDPNKGFYDMGTLYP